LCKMVEGDVWAVATSASVPAYAGMGFGAAKPPREVFLGGVWGGAPHNTTQKLGFGAQPQDVASAVGKWVVVLANLVNVGV
jgi:hypothetical protein